MLPLNSWNKPPANPVVDSRWGPAYEFRTYSYFDFGFFGVGFAVAGFTTFAFETALVSDAGFFATGFAVVFAVPHLQPFPSHLHFLSTGFGTGLFLILVVSSSSSLDSSAITLSNASSVLSRIQRPLSSL